MNETIKTFGDLAEYITGKRDARISECEHRLLVNTTERIKLTWHAIGHEESVSMWIPLAELDECSACPQVILSFPFTENRFEDAIVTIIRKADDLFNDIYSLGDKEW